MGKSVGYNRILDEILGQMLGEKPVWEEVC